MCVSFYNTEVFINLGQMLSALGLVIFIPAFGGDSPHCTIFNGDFQTCFRYGDNTGSGVKILLFPCGKSLIPIILRVKTVDADVDLVELSRIKKDEPLESYSKAALIANFENWTAKQ